MKNTLTLFCLLVGTSFCLFSCQMPESSIIKKNDGKIPIVTTNEVIGIHTKMIAGEKAFVVSLRKNTAPSSPEKELIYDAGIIMSDFPIAGSPLEKILQKYTGTYLNIAE